MRQLFCPCLLYEKKEDADMTQHATRMTEGSIPRHIVSFALPVFLGQLFQQLYNVADALVVGNVLGPEALAAVTSSGSLIFLLVGMFSGIFIGAGVVVSRYWGARDEEHVSQAVHTMLAFGIAAGAVLTVIGVLLTPTILRWMGTPEEVMPNSVLYFRIYFSGVLTIILYNVSNGIFQAVGDSRHPLYFLIVSSCTNVVLDLLLVAVCGFGIAGAAIATVISQGISAFLGLRRLSRATEAFRLDVRKVRFHRDMLGQILHMGIPSGIQNSIISLANIVVQSHINSFGALAMAGSGAYAKVEGFGFLPVTSFSMALTTFIGQNLGAKRYDRVKKGARFGVLTCATMAEMLGLLIYWLIPVFITAFNDTPEVIAYGTIHARTTTLFYFLLAFSHAMAGVFRGAGKSVVPMVVMMVCWCVIRITYVSLVVPMPPLPDTDIRTLFACYPITWFLSSLAFTVYYFKADWVHAYERKAHPTEAKV